MYGYSPAALGAVGSLTQAQPVLAADPGRMDLLAQEAARLATTPVPVDGMFSLPWSLLALVFAATMAAAFLGTFLGTRRFVSVPSGGKDWREVTYRFKSGRPLRFRRDTLDRMSRILGDLEGLGSQLRRETAKPAPQAHAPEVVPPENAPEASEPRTPKAPVTFRRRQPLPQASPPATGRPSDRRGAYERARQLLQEGHDPSTVSRMTGLKSAEIDLLGAAPVIATHREAAPSP